MSMNFYHKAFLTWSFKRSSYEFSTPMPQEGEWHVRYVNIQFENLRLIRHSLPMKTLYFVCSNHLFYGRHEPQLLSKKQAEDKLNISLYSLLCCRLHQGYTVKVSQSVEKEIWFFMCLFLCVELLHNFLFHILGSLYEGRSSGAESGPSLEFSHIPRLQSYVSVARRISRSLFPLYSRCTSLK